MIVRISQINLPPGDSPQQLLQAAARVLRSKPAALSDVKTVRRSIDARGRTPRMTVTADATFSGPLRRGIRNAREVEPQPPTPPVVSAPHSGPRPLVVGAGPAGLMSALALAEAGRKPLLIERGEATAPRAARVTGFWKQGAFDSESNVLYGEGGAGLFSDGKLTSRSKDRPRIRRFFETLVECGASPNILIDAEPHLGSDVLEALVPSLRRGRGDCLRVDI